MGQGKTPVGVVPPEFYFVNADGGVEMAVFARGRYSGLIRGLCTCNCGCREEFATAVVGQTLCGPCYTRAGWPRDGVLCATPRRATDSEVRQAFKTQRYI